MADRALPLDGIRVLDLSQILAGPYCTMVLGDLGADVVKVERPGSGDGSRQWGPPFAGDESVYYLQVNRSKRSVAIDLKDPDGVAVAQRLAATADVIIENFLPGAAERYGLDHATHQRHQSRRGALLDPRLSVRPQGCGAAGLRLRGAGHRRHHEHDRRARGRPDEGGSRDQRHRGRALRG